MSTMQLHLSGATSFVSCTQTPYLPKILCLPIQLLPKQAKPISNEFAQIVAESS